MRTWDIKALHGFVGLGLLLYGGAVVLSVPCGSPTLGAICNQRP